MSKAKSDKNRFELYIDSLIARKPNMTQISLSQKLGMTNNSFSQKKMGYREFTGTELKTIAKELNTSIDELMRLWERSKRKKKDHTETGISIRSQVNA